MKRKKLMSIALTTALTVSAFCLGSATTTEARKETLIPLSQCIPLSDISMTWEGPNGSPVFELKDGVNSQLRKKRNRSYKSIQKQIKRQYRKVEEISTGVLITFQDGTGYYFDK